ncbi:potassium channel protein [soil metagenome]
MSHPYTNFLKKLYIAIAMIIGGFVFGVSGFMLIEKLTFSEAFYTTLIILSTVGLAVVKDLSEAGRWFVSVLIIVSIGIFAYAVSVLTSFIMEGELRNFLNYRKVRKAIDQLHQHVIVCGYGRNGKQACEQLRSHKQKFVVIESNERTLQELKNTEHDILFIEGDATKDEVLLEAAIGNARAIITTLPNDAANVFVVLTARELNPKLKIISRASEDSSEGKLKRAGANNVIMPDKIGGTHMASLVTRPDVIEFIDYITGRINIRLEEILYNNLSDRLKGKTIRELEIRNKTGANIIGFKTEEGDYIINPNPDTVMNPGAKLFVLGTEQQVAVLLQVLQS